MRISLDKDPGSRINNLFIDINNIFIDLIHVIDANALLHNFHAFFKVVSRIVFFDPGSKIAIVHLCIKGLNSLESTLIFVKSIHFDFFQLIYILS